MKLRTDVKSYGERTDKSMQTWIQILRAFQKIRAKELKYINECGLTMNQFEVLEVLYHRGDLQIGAITKLIMSTPGNVTVVVRNLKTRWARRYASYARRQPCANAQYHRRREKTHRRNVWSACAKSEKLF